MRLRERMPPLAGATGRANGGTATDGPFGKPTLVLFWTAGCSCSEALLPRLEAWRSGFGMEAIGVFVPKDAPADEAAARRTIERCGVAYPVLLDGAGAIAEAFGNERVPTAYLFDEAGRLRHVQTGVQGLALLERRVRTLSERK